MEPIIYKPFCGYRGLGWTLIIVTFIFCLLSVIFFIPALLLLLLALFMLRASTVTVVLDDAGVRILHEKTCRDRFIPWEELRAYRLDSDPRGHDILILSPTPIPAEAAKWLISRRYLSTKLWFDGVLVLPLSGMESTEAVRKFAYQKCIHK